MLICEGCAELKEHPSHCAGCRWAARRYGIAPKRRRSRRGRIRSAERAAAHAAWKAIDTKDRLQGGR